MQLSAKLNVFLGVPNLAEQFLPTHLAFLRHYMALRPMNLFFPVAVTVGLVATVLVACAAGIAPSRFEATAFTMLAALLALAVLEHWLLVVPLRLDRLWNWSIAGAASAERSAAVASQGGDGAPERQAASTPTTARLICACAESALINPVVS